MEHLDIYLVALLGTVGSLAMWAMLNRALKARGLRRLRSVLLCLPLVLVFALYGLFWAGFFSSATTAVQLHAVKLTLAHLIEGYGWWIAGGWLLVSLLPLRPLLKC